jgi:hypothetical protein
VSFSSLDYYINEDEASHIPDRGVVEQCGNDKACFCRMCPWPLLCPLPEPACLWWSHMW